MADSRIARIVAGLMAAHPRVVVLVAPPGFAKLTVARSFATAGPLRTCRMPAHAADMARALLDALVGSDTLRGARLSADRLARRAAQPSTADREMLRREWSAETDDVVLLHDPAGGLNTPTGAELWGELIRTLPAPRRLVVATRAPLPPSLTSACAPGDAVTLGRDDLTLDELDVDRIANRAGVGWARTDLFGLTGGWPVVTRLAIDDVRERGAVVMDELAALPRDAWFEFATHRAVVRLAERVREALVVASFFDRVRYLDLVRILGPECDDAVFARMVDLPFVDREGAFALVHPDVRRMLPQRFGHAVVPLYERTLAELRASGLHLAAARIALDAGDRLRAAEIVDAAPPYTSAPVPVGEYERVIERLDPRMVTRFPNIWVVTAPYRSFSLEPATYIREAETVFFCLPARAGDEQRAAVLMLLASAYTNVGRSADAMALLGEALTGFAAEESATRAQLLNFMASLLGIEGCFTAARRLATEAAGMARDQFGENQTLHYIEAHEAAFRGRQGRLIVILDELQRRRAGDPPLYRAYVAMNGALFSWAAGDDAAFARYHAAFEDSITPAVEWALRELIAAARDRPAPPLDQAEPWPLVTAVANLYRMSHARTAHAAREAARHAARAADLRGAPFTRLLAHAALYVLDEPNRASESAILREIVANVESVELRAAVEGLVAGGSPGMLERFVRLRVLRTSPACESRLVVELLAGRVTRDGEDVRLRGKEFELIALLASTRGSLSRDEIGEALWEHLEADEWRNNLKVTMYRMRKALGSRDLTTVEDSRHRLARNVEVDLQRGEVLVRGLGTTLDDVLRAELRSLVRGLGKGTVERYERYAWSQSLVARMHDLACTAGSAIAQDALLAGAFDEALIYAAGIRDVDPLNERACELTVRALLERGDPDAARREFRRYEAALERELAGTPPAALCELVRTG